MRNMASGHDELQKTSMSSVEEVSHSGGPPEAGATGPLLSPGPRPAAASSNGSVGPQDGQILCIKKLAGHIVSAQGSSREGQVTGNIGCGSASVQGHSLYLLSPALLALFKSLGAENRPYTFQEVQCFLNGYLLSNCHLFDKNDNSFVNCDGDHLGSTFGVKRFHFNDVRYLLERNVHKIGVAPPPVAGGITQSASHNGFPLSNIQSNGSHRQPFMDKSLSYQSKYCIVYNENGKTNGESRDSSGCSTEIAGSAHRSMVSWRGTSSDETTSSLQHMPVDPTQSKQEMAINAMNGAVLVCDLSRGRTNPSDKNTSCGQQHMSDSSIISWCGFAKGRDNLGFTNTSCGVQLLSDSSIDTRRRSETEVSGYDNGPVKRHSKVHIVLEEDDTPVSNSDAETVYSYQGYETAFCRNTEDEESEEEESDLFEDLEYEEYELASDDDVVSEQPLSDDDSELEDIEVAVVTVMYEDEDDEVCWGDDDSDSESSSASDSDTDTDPDLAKEKWACLRCNKKNKAFMRYCEKCWQQRKNWLPDCPKRRRRRKSRPKKPKKPRVPQNSLKTRAPLESLPKRDSAGGNQESDKKIGTEGSSKTDVSSAELDIAEKRLSRTLSDASTVSIDELLEIMSAEEGTSGSYRPLEAECSQDSGIGTSQTFSSGTSQNTSVGRGSENEIKAEKREESKIFSCRTSQSISVAGDSEKCSEIKVEKREGSKSKSASEAYVLIDKDKLLYEDTSEIVTISVLSEESAMPSTSKAKPSSEAALTKTESEPSLRTLKRKHTQDVFVAACVKRSRSDRTLPEDESLGENDETDAKNQAQSVVSLLQSKIEFLQSESGEKWASTADGKRYMSRILQAEISDFQSAGIADISAHRMCSLCFIRPKNAIVVHGRRSHQFSCYPCAKRLLNSKSRCPICRQKIHMVTQNVVV